MERRIAVLDVGKTNVKLSLIGAESGRTYWTGRRPTAARQGAALRELDVAGIEAWLLDRLAAAPERHLISHIVPVAHGAAVVLLDAAGETLCAPDYEDPIFETVAAAYAQERDPFALTLSPDLPLGLNVGRQLFHLQTQIPKLFERARWSLPYPQYWAWRLSGVMASEVTSLGCHTDLWLPLEGRYATLARRFGWAERFPPMRRAGDVLGPVTPAVRHATGLNETCAILCGLHDSNASYLRHLLAHGAGERFSVVSSGTWCVVMARGAGLATLQESQGMLANVDAFGQAVPTARFMGGREFETIAGVFEAAPGWADLAAVLARGSLALPSFAPGGLFGDRQGRLVRAEGLDPAGRAGLATLYLALMTDAVLDALHSAGPIIVDGPLAANALYGGALQALRPTDQVRLTLDQSGAALSACYLATGDTALPPLRLAEALPDPALLDHARTVWREAMQT